MTNIHTILSQLSIKNIAYYMPFFGIICIIIPMLFGEFNLSLLGMYLALPMILAPITYFILEEKKNKSKKINPYPFKLFLIAYFILFAISIVELHRVEVRSYLYYTIIVFIGTIILIEILTFDLSNKRTYLILFQIMILCLNILWGVTLKYNYYFGLTDVFGHSWFIQNLVHGGHITEVFRIYKPFPLWHILNAIGYYIYNLPLEIYKIMFINNGIVFSFLVLLMYLITLNITKNKTIALLASLFTIFYPPIIMEGMYSIPRSAILFFEVLLLFLLLTSDRPKKKIIMILITIITIMYHTVSTPFILVILLAIFIYQHKIQNESNSISVSKTYLVIISLFTVAYWMYYGEILFETIVNSLTTTIPSYPKAVFEAPINELYNYIQYSFIIFYLLLGVFWSALSYKNNMCKTYTYIALLSVLVSFPGPLQLLEKLTGYGITRFAQYTFVFIIIASAIGYFKLYYSTNQKLKVIVIFIFILGSFLSISNDFTASDNPIVKRPFFTHYLTQEEIIATTYLAQVSNGYLMSDYVIGRSLISSPYESKYHIIEVDNKTGDFIKSKNSDIIFVRNGELNKRPLYIYISEKPIFQENPTLNSWKYYDQKNSIRETIKSREKIYTTGDTIALK